MDPNIHQYAQCAECEFHFQVEHELYHHNDKLYCFDCLHSIHMEEYANQQYQDLDEPS